jgi:hypothetical protein
VEARLRVSRRTYIFAGPSGSDDVLMSIVESALGRAFVRENGDDPYILIEPVNVYVGGHEFEDDDIESPTGELVPLETDYPLVVDIRDTERDSGRQEDVAARIFDAIRADGRLRAVYIDDMQHVLDVYSPGASPASG